MRPEQRILNIRCSRFVFLRKGRKNFMADTYNIYNKDEISREIDSKLNSPEIGVWEKIVKLEHRIFNCENPHQSTDPKIPVNREENIKKIRAEFEKLQKPEESIEDLRRKLEEKEQECSALQKQNQELQKDIDDLQRDNPYYNRYNNEFQNQQTNTTDEEIVDKKKQTSAISEHKNKGQNLKKKYKILKTKYKGLKTKYKNLKIKYKNLKIKCKS